MHLLAISNHLQIYGDRNGERLLLVNKLEKDFAFRRVMFTWEEARTIKNLLDSLTSETEPEENQL